MIYNNMGKGLSQSNHSKNPFIDGSYMEVYLEMLREKGQKHNSKSIKKGDKN